MSIDQALFLGIIQGLTEFVPISSSGHLVIAQSIIPEFSQPGVTFDVFLHAGTSLAVLIYFWRKIIKLSSRFIILIVIASLPAAFLGLVFQNNLEMFFASTKIVGAALIITGIINFQIDKFAAKNERNTKAKAFIIGIAQSLAIVPGISRSGLTIFAGTFLGLNRRKAAEFSFLLSVPVIMGANILQFATHMGEEKIDLLIYMVGFITAGASGYFAIKLVISFLTEKRFIVFSLYCFLIGVLTLVFL